MYAAHFFRPFASASRYVANWPFRPSITIGSSLNSKSVPLLDTPLYQPKSRVSESLGSPNAAVHESVPCSLASIKVFGTRNRMWHLWTDFQPAGILES